MSILDNNILENTDVLKDFPAFENYTVDTWKDSYNETITRVMYTWNSILFKNTAFEDSGISVCALSSSVKDKLDDLTQEYHFYLCYDNLTYGPSWTSSEYKWTGDCDVLCDLDYTWAKSDEQSMDYIAEPLYIILNNIINYWKELIMELIGPKGFLNNLPEDFTRTYNKPIISCRENESENQWNTGSPVFKKSYYNSTSLPVKTAFNKVYEYCGLKGAMYEFIRR